MPLREFVHAHPDCHVGRPDVLTPLCVALLSGAACLAATGLALASIAASTADPMGALVLFTFALAAGWITLRSLPRLSASLSVARRGAAYAISDEALMLVGDSGRTVMVHFDRVTGLTMHGAEPRLYVDADAQGLVHAIMFELFDSDGCGPSAERFFQRLADKLRAHAPEATISRSALVDAGLIHEHP
jgi:hypothetical protein